MKIERKYLILNPDRTFCSDCKIIILKKNLYEIGKQELTFGKERNKKDSENRKFIIRSTFVLTYEKN